MKSGFANLWPNCRKKRKYLARLNNFHVWPCLSGVNREINLINNHVSHQDIFRFASNFLKIKTNYQLSRYLIITDELEMQTIKQVNSCTKF